jgi:hypothetical protein
MQADIGLELPDNDSWQPYTVISSYVSSKPRVTGPLLEALGGVSEDVWYALASWAKERNVLQAWQRGLAFSLGKIAGRRGVPSQKQATQGRKLLLAAIELGFVHTDLAAERVAMIEDAD